jgi:hypothetical protein
MVKVYDKEGKEHQKESVDARECVEVLGWTYEKQEELKLEEPKQENKNPYNNKK